LSVEVERDMAPETAPRDSGRDHFGAAETRRFLRSQAILGVLTVGTLVAALYLVFLYAPPERDMGEIQRLFYFHVASGWLAMVAFTVVFIGSLLYLWRGHLKYDRWAEASAGIGVLFTTIVLVTGPLWARPIWNTWWPWEPRLTSSLVLWIMYAAYLLLRGNFPESRKKYQICSVYAIVAFLDVPLVFFSVRRMREAEVYRGLHPVVISANKIDLEPEMILALVVSCLAFTLLYVWLWRFRLRVGMVRDEIWRIRRVLMERE